MSRFASFPVFAPVGADRPTGIPKEHYIRMKRSLALIATLASGFVLSAAAQTLPAPAAAAPAGPAKIAVIAFQVAVAQTNEGQRDFSDLQKKFDPKRKQLQAESEEIVNLSKQLQADKVKLSPADQKSRAAAIEAKKKQLGSEAEAAQGAFQQEMEKDFDALAAKVYDVMAGYAKLQGYTVVLDVTQKATPVLYADDSANITEEVVKAYNEKSGVPAPPAPAATAAPKPAPQPSAPPAAH